MKNIIKPLIATALLAGATHLSAQTVTNGSFESPVQGPPGYGDFPTGYLETANGSGAGVETYATALAGGQTFVGGTGDQLLGINSQDSNGVGPIVYQDAGALQANMKYTLTVSEAAPVSGQYGAGTNSFTLLLYVGTDDSTTPVNSTTTTIASPSGDTSTFQTESVSYTTGADVAGEDLTFGLQNTTISPSAPAQDEFDTVVLTATSTLPATPEPSTYALMGLGLALLIATMRSRRSFLKV